MASGQNSFPKQVEAAKQNRSHWSRTRSADDAFRTNSSAVNRAMTGRPITASVESKSKLKAFQFIEGRPSSQSAQQAVSKENQITTNGKRNGCGAKSTDDSAKPTAAKVPPLVQSKTCPPSTPATRLPLADLIGNSESISRQRNAPAVSPEEHIYWLHARSPSSNIAATPARKRARSSSPISSSQNASARKEPFDLQQMQQSLKTPKADPAADLWHRYAVNTGSKGTPTVSKGAALAQLINDSSPRSSATAGSVSGLRRWASCGVEWPTSRAKRRRTTGVFRDRQEKDGDVFDPAPECNGEKPKVSKLELLLEKMQSALPKPPRERQHDGPSSSSPLPETGAFHAGNSDSPTRRLASVLEGGNEDGMPGALDSPPDDEAADVPRIGSRMSSSNFGDLEDIDPDELDAVDCAAENAVAEQNQDGIVDEPMQLHQQVSQEVSAELVEENFFDDDDDFDDFDDGDETFAADLENLASMYDHAPAPRTSTVPAHDSVPSGASEHNLPGTSVEPAVVRNAKAESSEDEFGGDDIDIDELAAAEAVATQAYHASESSQPHSGRNPLAIQRYLVTKVAEGTYTSEQGQSQPEKILLVEDERSGLTRAITLRQAWYKSQCTVGSYVHVIGEFSVTGQCCIDDSKNMLILHPDHLISATVVADSFGCIRRAVLQDRVKATSDANAPMLYGQILHELFQEAMKANRWDSDWLFQTIQTIIPRHLETILQLAFRVEQVVDNLKSKMPNLQAWAQLFVRATPALDATVKNGSERATMSINKLLDVEEHVWSPTYGLKGNIDATVQVVMNDSNGERTLTVPFEVKTGRSVNIAHQAQTALYTLLTSDRYDVDVTCGILYYLETSEVSRIPAIRHHLRDMIMQRNELACYVRERLQLPPMLRNSRLCGKCYAKVPCFLYHKLSEDGNGEDLDSRTQFEDLVRHIKQSDLDFFIKWDALLTKEESEMMKFRRELWTMLSTEREKLGRCFANVIVEPGSACELPGMSKINRFQYALVKRKPAAGFSFTESQITVGEPIVISDERGHFALANGYVTHVRKDRITVAVDRRLHNSRIKKPDFDAETNQSYSGIMEVTREDLPTSTSQAVAEDEPTLYRLDKDEFSAGMATIRNNLIQLMDDRIYKTRELRSLVVEGRPPTFHPSPTAYTLATRDQMAINSDQRAAIEKVMSAKDYALVLGMPGTGKTTTIAQIIRALVAKGKSVLLTSYTHTAVDNILLKIRQDGIGILRLGALAKVHPEVREFAVLAAEPKATLQELQQSWEEPPVVATTCLGINHPIFSRRIFDYCIVDEASQITLPVCLGPIRMATKFILVGDHFQLPPLVQNKEALEGGLDVSLFKLLSERHPHAVVNLEHQYRMCSDVMLLSNELIYGGRLKCGNEAVASRSLHIPNTPGLDQHHFRSLSSDGTKCPGPGLSCWLTRIIDPLNKVIFLDTDALLPESQETVSGPRIINNLEAILTAQVIETFLSTGVTISEVGVISFYRSQLSLLRQSLHHRPGVEMHTADKFQGRDKEVIVVSCVRSNDAKNVGDLLKDWRRINVAVTRARSKLIILGSAKTLSGNDLLARLVGLCKQRGWLVNLRKGDVRAHSFEESRTQTGPTQGFERSPEKADPTEHGVSPAKRAMASPPKEWQEEDSPVKNVWMTGSVLDMLTVSPVRKTGWKKPEMVGIVSKRGIVNSRPVLRDIVNDVA